MLKSKIVSLATLKRKLPQLRKQGKQIAFTNGCFDIIHAGHVRYLAKAKKKNRILIIGLNSDTSVKKIKGPSRPIVNEDDRATVLSAFECVDFIVKFSQETPYNLIAAVRPDVLIKGADWKDKGIVGSDIVKAYGGKIEYITFVAGRSSTNIIGKIEARAKRKS